MIAEFLSSESWLNPQIDFLLWLQNIRLSTGGIFDKFFLDITALGELIIPTFFMCIVYWCIDTDAGLYLLSLNSMGLLLSKYLKMVACIYRPWVLSDKIKPVEAAIKMSGGYSFPSGHSAMAATVWGGLAFLLRKKKFISILLILLVLLIGFSRMYVGVHTPQDVISSLILGFGLIFITHWGLEWCKGDKNRLLYLLVGMNVLALVILYYVLTKKYTVDFSNPEVLKIHVKAMYITILYIGFSMGVFNGAFLCKRFFPFDAKQGSVKNKVTRGIIGVLIIVSWFLYFEDYLFNPMRRYRVVFTALFIVGFFITAIYPFIFSKLTKCNKNI